MSVFPASSTPRTVKVFPLAVEKISVAISALSASLLLDADWETVGNYHVTFKGISIELTAHQLV